MTKMLRGISRAIAAASVVIAGSLAIATPALAGTHDSGYGMSISPAAVQGPQYSTATFTVKNTGTKPIEIKTSVVELAPVAGQPKVWIPDKVFKDAKIAPKQYDLAPGQRHPVMVTVRSTDGYAHNLAVMVMATPPTVKVGASVGTALAAKFVIEGKPKAYQPITVPIPSEGFPWTLAAGVGLAITSGAAVGYAVYRRHTRKQAS
jgi:hypothetical protein